MNMGGPKQMIMIRKTMQIVSVLNVLSFAQITVNINSGNPVYPFPQFQPYANPTDTLGNLATRTPVGVSHAEMEKSIREAYQILMNGAEKSGIALEGTNYIHFRSSPDCTEGDGYAMLAAAAMADKTTFDGLWLWVHENRMNNVTSYYNCKPTTLDYRYSRLPGWTQSGANSAADADFDIALALLCAYRQWGEFMGINDKCGNPISYKQAAVDFITALTDTFTYVSSGTGLISGDIGLDGYFKSGDTWRELTNWAKNTAISGIPKPPEMPGPQQQYADYMAPSYFHQFANFLAGIDSAKYAWNINQFRRAEASSDWLMGQLLSNPQYIPNAGRVDYIDSSNMAKFSKFNEGEDFRLGWRTILNRVWNGNPSTSWDPVAHQVKPGTSNTYEQDIGKRYARFLWDRRQQPWQNGCDRLIQKMPYWGTSVLVSDWKIDGSEALSPFLINWIQGTGSPSAVVAQDFNLMAEMYRNCEINFDAEKIGDNYLTSVPRYFDGWFRLLGMLVLSGNYPAPSSIKPMANMKVYCDVDKTFVFPGDEVTYALSYRDYGSINAQDVKIIDTLPPGLAYVSSTQNGIFNQSSRTVTWNIGTVSGFKTAEPVANCTGEVTLKVRIDENYRGQCHNRATIACSNGTGWTSNEYPNTISATLKRNFVDVIDPSFRDTTGGKIIPPLHGGRPGVHFSFWYRGNVGSAPENKFGFRLFNDAQEPYIDYNNYRISLFFYDEKHNCIKNTINDGCDSGWSILNEIVEGVDKRFLKFLVEKLTPDEAANGKWNLRFIIQFSDPTDTNRTEKIATITQYLEEYRGYSGMIHKGGTEPLRLISRINAYNWQNVQWDDDWSWNSEATGTDTSMGYPVTPDFTDPSPGNPGVPVDRLNPKHCVPVSKTITNVLIEEWDGYTWRKVFGSSPYAFTTSPHIKRNIAIKGTVINLVNSSGIRFSLPAPGEIQMQLLNLQGRTVATLAKGYCGAGNHTVKLTSGSSLGSEIYLIRLITKSGTIIKRVPLLRK
jgi:uncharacterized repeat protein (TIGR01451 family)